MKNKGAERSDLPDDLSYLGIVGVDTVEDIQPTLEVLARDRARFIEALKRKDLGRAGREYYLRQYADNEHCTSLLLRRVSLF